MDNIPENNLQEHLDEVAWVPLEGSPEALNSYMVKLGVNDDFIFHDILGLEYLDFIPRPVLAVILLTPVTHLKGNEDFNREMPTEEEETTSNLFFIRQAITNACGAIAVLHSTINSKSFLTIQKDSPLSEFINTTSEMNPEERGVALIEADRISKVHEETVLGEGPRVLKKDDKVKHHFLTFVQHDGHIYELDGRLNLPIRHTKLNENDDFLQVTSKLCQNYMDINKDQCDFIMMALAPNFDY